MAKAKATGGFGEEAKAAWRSPAADARSGRVAETLAAAERSGLIRAGKAERISARVSPELLAQAKQKTGIAGATELLEFALATIALDDRFIETMTKLDGAVDQDIKLGF